MSSTEAEETGCLAQGCFLQVRGLRSLFDDGRFFEVSSKMPDFVQGFEIIPQNNLTTKMKLEDFHFGLHFELFLESSGASSKASNMKPQSKSRNVFV